MAYHLSVKKNEIINVQVNDGNRKYYTKLDKPDPENQSNLSYYLWIVPLNHSYMGI